MKAIKKIDNRLKSIDCKIRFLSRLNPLNARSEYRKFFSAYRQQKPYNPVFKYKPIKPNLAALLCELANLTIKIPPVKNERWFFATHLESKRKRIIEKINALTARGSPQFHHHSQRLFNAPSPTQVAYASRILRNNAQDAFTKIKDNLSSSEAASYLQKYLNEKGLHWSVKVRRHISSKAGLDYLSRYLLVKQNDNFAPEEVLSLAVHEIETHIYRRENGMRQSFPGLFGEGFAGPPTTEEGLALFNELYHNYDPRRMVIMCARTFAVNLAQNNSFVYVFSKLLEYGLPIPYAWATTLRAKRGFSDTALPGAFGKDHHYLKGYLEVKNFLANGGSIKSLYIGKLNINNIKSLERLNVNVVEPKYFPLTFIGHDH